MLRKSLRKVKFRFFCSPQCQSRSPRAVLPPISLMPYLLALFLCEQGLRRDPPLSNSTFPQRSELLALDPESRMVSSPSLTAQWEWSDSFYRRVRGTYTTLQYPELHPSLLDFSITTSSPAQNGLPALVHLTPDSLTSCLTQVDLTRIDGFLKVFKFTPPSDEIKQKVLLPDGKSNPCTIIIRHVHPDMNAETSRECQGCGQCFGWDQIKYCSFFHSVPRFRCLCSMSGTHSPWIVQARDVMECSSVRRSVRKGIGKFTNSFVVRVVEQVHSSLSFNQIASFPISVETNNSVR